MIRKSRCPECGQPHWFRYWVADNVPGSKDGICTGDFDMPFHRFSRIVDGRGVRDIEHLMVVEIKTADEKLGAAQRDTLSVFNGALESMVPVDGAPINVKSRPGFILKGDKKIVWHGVHLLRAPAQPCEVGPFYWDNQRIYSDTLARVLAFEFDPNKPSRRLDIERRHKRKPIEYPALFVVAK